MSDKNYSETHRTVNTRNINRMLLCCKEKANKAWKTKPETATVISLWFWGFLMYPELKSLFSRRQLLTTTTRIHFVLASLFKFVNPSEV